MDKRSDVRNFAGRTRQRKKCRSNFVKFSAVISASDLRGPPEGSRGLASAPPPRSCATEAATLTAATWRWPTRVALVKQVMARMMDPLWPGGRGCLRRRAFELPARVTQAATIGSVPESIWQVFTYSSLVLNQMSGSAVGPRLYWYSPTKVWF